MKKAISIILALTLGATLLTGCGSTQQGTGAADAGASGDASATAAVSTAEDAEVPEGAYVIYVKDAESGNPIEGAKIQFCSDLECRLGTTDGTGMAVFEADPGDYTAHLLKTPEGYEENTEELVLTADNHEGTIKLKKAGDTAAEEDEDSGETDIYEKTDASWDCENSGFEFTLPADFKDLKGQVTAMDNGETGLGSGIFCGYLAYIGRTDEETRKAEELFNSIDFDNDPDATEKAQEISIDYYSVGLLPFLYVLGINESIDCVTAVNETFGEDAGLTGVELGQAGSYKYYYIVPNTEAVLEPYAEKIPEDLIDEYKALGDRAEEIAAAMTVKEPVITDMPPEVGSVISFETKDLDGNVVKSEDLFAGHKITMINIWATWCGPCVKEFPELEELSKELAEKDCQIIGICDDARGEDETIIAEAKRLIEENGITYTNIIQTEELEDLLPLTAFPTTYFVDSEGKILTMPVTGAYPDQYRARIEEALATINS